MMRQLRTVLLAAVLAGFCMFTAGAAHSGTADEIPPPAVLAAGAGDADASAREAGDGEAQEQDNSGRALRVAIPVMIGVAGMEVAFFCMWKKR